MRLGASYAGGGDPGAVYEYTGGSPLTGTDLGSIDYSMGSPWTKVNLGLDDVRLNIGNLSASPAKAFGGLVVLNDVRSEVEARIEDTIVNAGEVIVSAIENVSLQSLSQSTIQSSGGSAFKDPGGGSVIAAQR